MRAHLHHNLPESWLKLAFFPPRIRTSNFKQFQASQANIGVPARRRQVRFCYGWSSKAGFDDGTHVLAFRVVNCQQKEVNSRVVLCLGPPTYIRILGNVSEKLLYPPKVPSCALRMTCTLETDFA